MISNETKEAPIEDVLDDILPEWREYSQRRAAEGATDLEIVGELRQQMHAQLDGLLDTYNALGGK